MSSRYSKDATIRKRKNYYLRFLNKAKVKFGERFDYSRVEYETQNKHVIIGCPNHGWFEMTPSKHLNSKFGCQKCGVEARAKDRKIQQKTYFLRNSTRYMATG